MSRARFFEWLLDHRWAVAAAGVALCAAAAYLGAGVRTDYNVEQFFPLWDPDRQTYEQYKQVFSKEDTQFALFWREGRPLDPELYETLEQAAAVFEDVGLYDVTWFGNVKVADNEVVDGQSFMRIHELVESRAPSQAELRAVLDRYADDPLYRNVFWNADQSVFVITGYLTREMNTDDGRRRAERELSTRLERFAAPERRLALTGIPYGRAQALKIIEEELSVLLAVAVAGLFLLMYAFVRNWRHVLLCLAAIVPGYLVAQGLMGLFDWPVTLLTSFLPIIVLAIGFTDTIHLLTHYQLVRADTDDHREAIVRAFSELSGACLFTSLTTSIGFLSLIATRIEIVVDFAVVTALAVFLCWVAAMVFFPVLLSFGAGPRAAERPRVRLRWLDGLIGLAAVWGRTRAGPVIASGAVLVLVFGWFARNLHENNFMFDLVKSDHPIMKDLRWVESEGFGLFQVDVLVEGSEGRPVADLPVIRWLDELERFVEGEPLVVLAGSFLDHLRQVRRAVLEGRPEAYRLPDSYEEAGQLLLLAESSDPGYLEDVYVESTQQAQLVIVVQDVGSKRTLPFLGRLETYLAEHPPPDGVRARSTGTVKLAQTAFRRLTAGFAISLSITVLLIFLIMAAMFRSPRWGLVALVPNLVPLIMLFGLFAVSGYSVKPSHAIVFAIVFGVAVDDAIHMLGFLRRLRAQGCPPGELVQSALHTSGRAIVITTLVIGSGFAVLSFSSFEWVGLLGLLTPFALGVALLSNLFLLPALLHALNMVKA